MDSPSSTHALTWVLSNATHVPPGVIDAALCARADHPHLVHELLMRPEIGPAERRDLEREHRALFGAIDEAAQLAAVAHDVTLPAAERARLIADDHSVSLQSLGDVMLHPAVTRDVKVALLNAGPFELTLHLARVARRLIDEDMYLAAIDAVEANLSRGECQAPDAAMAASVIVTLLRHIMRQTPHVMHRALRHVTSAQAGAMALRSGQHLPLAQFLDQATARHLLEHAVLPLPHQARVAAWSPLWQEAALDTAWDVIAALDEFDTQWALTQLDQLDDASPMTPQLTRALQAHSATFDAPREHIAVGMSPRTAAVSANWLAEHLANLGGAGWETAGHLFDAFPDGVCAGDLVPVVRAVVHTT